MNVVEETLSNLKIAYGEPNEGFDDFLKSCTYLDPFIPPTNCLKLCKGYLLPTGTRLHQIMIQPYHDSRTMQARDTDVLVDSYPKTGTTWTEEICYLIMHGTDMNKVNTAPTEVRIPFIEIPVQGIRAINEMSDPRLIKTHLAYDEIPASFLEKKTKVVYIARNPKDTAVSYYHFVKLLGYIQFSGDFATFLDKFLNGEVMYSSYAENVLSFWNRRHQSNILFLTYEDLHENFRAEVRKVAEFLGVKLTEEQVTIIEQHCSFDSMSKNPMTNYSQGGAAVKTPDSPINFMRKGKVGDWKNYFTEELNEKMDKYIEKHFKGTGLNFKYEV